MNEVSEYFGIVHFVRKTRLGRRMAKKNPHRFHDRKQCEKRGIQKQPFCLNEAYIYPAEQEIFSNQKRAVVNKMEKKDENINDYRDCYSITLGH